MDPRANGYESTGYKSHSGALIFFSSMLNVFNELSCARKSGTVVHLFLQKKARFDQRASGCRARRDELADADLAVPLAAAAGISIPVNPLSVPCLITDRFSDPIGHPRGPLMNLQGSFHKVPSQVVKHKQTDTFFFFPRRTDRKKTTQFPCTRIRVNCSAGLSS